MSMALYGCAHFDKSASTSENYSILSFPKRLIGQPAKPELSEWHRDSLDMCLIHETEQLTEFALPVSVNLWDRVRDGFSLDTEINRRIQQEIDWYSKHPSYMARVSERAEKYLHYVVEEIERRQMPMELALLPIVESAFDPFAYSSGRAAGMWQVIPGTGKMLGLKQNWWYDGRRDVTASTDAALTYLEQLYNQLGKDWLLALAAYNSGAGNVQRAIKKNQASGKSTDYWSLKLPKETEMYVPRLLALKELVQNPEIYGLSFYPIANEPYFVSVDVGSQIDLAQAAEWAGMSTADLAALNPGFNRWATDPDGPHRLLLPRDKADAFMAKLAEVPVEQRVVWHRHQIKNGDTLSGLAQQYRTTVSILQTINNLTGTNLRAGQTLMVPSTGHPALLADNKNAPAQTNSKIEYRVQAGDSLWVISRKFDVTTQQLAQWNNLSQNSQIFPGQKLVIWQKTAAFHATPGGERTIRKVAYRVRKGDSLAAIASKFKVRVADITEWNQVNPSKRLQPGQNLTLYVDVTRVQ